MNLQKVKITLWIITIATLLWIGASIKDCAKAGRYKIVSWHGTILAHQARLDTVTGRIEPLIFDYEDQQVKTFAEFIANEK